MDSATTSGRELSRVTSECLQYPRAQATSAPPTLSLEKYSLTDNCTNLLALPLVKGRPSLPRGHGENSQDKNLRETRFWI